jgi:hypothetical protein
MGVERPLELVRTQQTAVDERGSELLAQWSRGGRWQRVQRDVPVGETALRRWRASGAIHRICIGSRVQPISRKIGRAAGE